MKEAKVKRTIVISGANLFSGGTLSVIQDCLLYLENNLLDEYRIVALVFDKKLYHQSSNIEFIEFPEVRKSYLKRLKLEYFYYKKLSAQLKPYLWLSLNDMSSSVTADRQAVYCHNPSPFKSKQLSDLVHEPSLFFFSLFYKYLYKINIHKNTFIIVQQKWIKEKFQTMFTLPASKIIVAPVGSKEIGISTIINHTKSDKKTFCFPTLARPFKNIEIICEAAALLVHDGIDNFDVYITVDGTENKYAANLVKKYSHLKQINFIGKISRTQVFELYNNSDCLIFPSKLETWGLPITEFKMFKKTIIIADLPYSRETIQDYNKTLFFNPESAQELCVLMKKVMSDAKITYHHTAAINYIEPFASDWASLFTLLLKN